MARRKRAPQRRGDRRAVFLSASEGLVRDMADRLEDDPAELHRLYPSLYPNPDQ